MARTTKLAIAVAIPLLIGAWAAFRPELLFVKTEINESAPSASDSKLVSRGEFSSYAHETKGKAEVLRANGKNILRLSDFETSNGPDVRVLLLKGTDPTKVQEGRYLDLGSIKGTTGNQNYELPEDLSGYGAVNIWCKRFSVGFGGAALTPSEPVTAASGLFRLASYSEEIRVTSGRFQGDAGKASGSVEMIERDGRRYLRLRYAKASAPVRVILVKAETIESAGTVKKSERLDLGPLKPGKEQLFPVPKKFDVWLWRSVSLWTKDGRNLADADLRSDQEVNKNLALA
jgi:hypothetical protein